MKKINFRKITSVITAAVMSLSLAVIPVSAEQSERDYGAEITAFAKENEGKYASFATAVFEGDEVLYSGYFGYANKETNLLADKETVYEWGSISKMFVWVSVMQLAEQGKLDLNADIRTYLPEDFFTKLKYDEPITMMNLINHNAGWQESIIGLEVTDEEDIIPLGEALRASEPEQVRHPGEVVAYSNWGAALAGYIVECVSGTDYVDYVHANILEPLGMEHTSVGADYRDNEWVRAQREKVGSYMYMIEMIPQGTDMHYINVYPAGSVTGTLEDITTFAQTFVSDNSPLFEKEETMAEFLSVTDTYGDSDIPLNCHGLWTTFFAEDTMGHGGNTTAGSANLLFNPETKTGVVVLTNQMAETTCCNGIPELVFGDIKDNPRFAPKEITEREDITGNYVSSRSFFKGILRVNTYMTLLGFTPTDDPDVYNVMGIATLTRIADHTYIYEYGTQKVVMYADTTSDGEMMLDCVSMAYIRDEMAVFNTIWIFATIAIAITYLIILIVKLIIFLVNKNKPTFNRVITTLGQLAMVIGTAVLFLGSSTTRAGLAVGCIIITLCGILSAGSAAILVRNAFADKEMKKSLRVRNIITAFFCILFAAFVLYFQLYNFWS